MGEALGRRVRHIDIPPRMFMKAVRVNQKRLGFDPYLQSGLRHYLPETALGAWEVAAPTTHVRDVAGVEPEDFLTIARRYVGRAETRRTASNFMRQLWIMALTGLVPSHRLDRFDRLQQHPRPAHPRQSAQSAIWRREHEPGDGRYGVIQTQPAALSQQIA
jgi:NAD(P)H dehydrogenase (quinone)